VDKPLQFGQLSPPRQSLIRLCQSINYGSIEDLTVRSREPVLSDSPLVLADVQLNAKDQPRPEATLSDFVLSTELVRLVSLLDQIGEGKISRIETRAGLPRRDVFARLVSECLGLPEFPEHEELEVACREAGRI
jgi:hypothetical protein